MRLTPVLSVRQWLAKLHPPAPQTPREAQQLLRILEGSFRKHLDEAHPSPAQRQAPGVSQHDIPLTSPTSSSSVTHHYLDSILNNPLLARRSDRRAPQASLTATAVTTFENAVSEGKVTIPIIRRCAADYLQGLKSGERLAETERFITRLNPWIYTANAHMKEAFFASPDTLSIAVQVAAIDRQEAVTWNWLRTLYERNFDPQDTTVETSLTDPKWLAMEDLLVSEMMRLSIRRGDIKDAAQQFVEACRYRTASGRAAVSPEDETDMLTYVPLDRSWKRLLASTIHHRNKHGIPDVLFDGVILYGLSWSSTPEFSVPVAMVYHPTKPSATMLSQHLQDPVPASQFISNQVTANKKFRRAMLMMILDASQLSLDQGARKQAQFLLDFAHTHYAEFLPSLLQRTSSATLDARIQSAQGDLRANSYNFAWT